MASKMDSVSTWPMSCRRVAPNDKRTAISIVRFAARASSRFAMFAHAINNTIAVIEKRSRIGVRDSLIIELCHFRPSLRTTFFALNCAMVLALIPFCNGTSTSLMRCE